MAFMAVEMLKPFAIDYHVSRRCEIDQPHAIRRSCRVEPKLSDSGTKDTLLPNLRIEIPEDNLDVKGRAFVESFTASSFSSVGACSQIRLILWNLDLMRILASLSFTGGKPNTRCRRLWSTTNPHGSCSICCSFFEFCNLALTTAFPAWR